jgi:hypothetical protein
MEREGLINSFMVTALRLKDKIVFQEGGNVRTQYGDKFVKDNDEGTRKF